MNHKSKTRATSEVLRRKFLGVAAHVPVGLRSAALIALFGLALLTMAAYARDSGMLHARAKVGNQMPSLTIATADPTVLPSGATMRGIWGPSGQLDVTASGTQITNISFPLLLPATPTFHPLTHWMLSSHSTKQCPGVVGGLPQAAPGNLCVYQTNTDALSNVESKTAVWGRLGIQLVLRGPRSRGLPIAEGVWAVTAP